MCIAYSHDTATVAKHAAMHWLLVDTSYLIFFRYYALLSWYRRAYPPTTTAPASAPASAPAAVAAAAAAAAATCPLFRKKLLKRVDDTLRLLARLHAPDRTVFCFDGLNNWRKQYYAEYKSTRVHTDALRALFAACVHRIRDEFCARADAPSVLALEHAELEADDIVHFLTRRLIPKTADSAEAARITIVASDHDYIPLLELPGVSIVDLKQKPVQCPRSIPLAHFLLVKILAGDKSDNIPPIFPGCGPKTALRLAVDPERLRRKLEESEAWRRNYERNAMLIDNTKLRDSHQAWLQQQFGRVQRARQL